MTRFHYPSESSPIIKYAESVYLSQYGLKVSFEAKAKDLIKFGHLGRIIS